MEWLDAAATAGVHVLMYLLRIRQQMCHSFWCQILDSIEDMSIPRSRYVGVDHLSRCVLSVYLCDFQ